MQRFTITGYLSFENTKLCCFLCSIEQDTLTIPLQSSIYQSPIQPRSAWIALFQMGFGCYLPILLQGMPSWAAPIPAVLPNWSGAMAVTSKGTLNRILPGLQIGQTQDMGLEHFCKLLLNLI